MIQGFTSHGISKRSYVHLGRSMQKPVISDLGSGSLIDLAQYGLPSAADATKDAPRWH